MVHKMVILSKPNRRTAVLNVTDSRKFVEEFNSKKPSPEFLKSCKKSKELFSCENTKIKEK